MKKPTQKKCPHVRTILPAPVAKRVLAMCVECGRLVDVTPAREAKR